MSQLVQTKRVSLTATPSIVRTWLELTSAICCVMDSLHCTGGVFSLISRVAGLRFPPYSSPDFLCCSHSSCLHTGDRTFLLPALFGELVGVWLTVNSWWCEVAVRKEMTESSGHFTLILIWNAHVLDWSLHASPTFSPHVRTMVRACGKNQGLLWSSPCWSEDPGFHCVFKPWFGHILQRFGQHQTLVQR